MKNYILILPLLLFFSGCSVQKLTIRAMKPVIENSMESLFEESDLEIGKSAIEADLKLLEALLKSDPENTRLLLYATQGFASYSLGFVEDVDENRARQLYLRAQNYGLQALKKNDAFKKALKSDFSAFENALQKFNKNDVPVLFWTANAWGNWINRSMTNPNALAEMPKVEAMMKRVLELDEAYFYGGAHLFFGTIYMVKPIIMGGNPEKAREHFEKCLTFSRKQFLLPYVFYARYYAAQLMEEELFNSLLETVQQADIDVLPNQRLPNAIAKDKAKRLQEMKSEYF